MRNCAAWPRIFIVNVYFPPSESDLNFTNIQPALSLSDSQRSSYLSNFSRRSILSSSSTHSHDSAATDNCSIEQPTGEYKQKWPDNYPGSPSGAQLATLATTFAPTHQSLQNQDSSHPTYTTQTYKPFCFTCNEQFKNKGSLSRHQKEQCERGKISACSLCPVPQPMYYTKERLLRHHVMSHGDRCPNGCSKKENKISIPCKEHLSESFEKLPSKKAWGCPYCVSCFKTFEEWNGHCFDHLKTTDKAPKWSFGTMIWSLLQQDRLMDARMRHDFPVTSNWSSVNEKTCSGLREILEHCRLPSVLRAREYWYLPEGDAVVRCIFHFIRTGLTLPSQQLFEVRSKPIPYQVSNSATEGRKDAPPTSQPIPEKGNANSGIKTFLCPPERADNATVSQTSASNKVTSGSQTHSSSAVDTAGAVRSRPVEIQDFDDGANGHPRKRGASLKRSLSNLALRPSSSKSPAVQTVAVPPVPPLPGETKAWNADKAGAGAGTHHDGDWPTHSYLDPIPQYRPMSGVVYGWSWSDGIQSQQ